MLTIHCCCCCSAFSEDATTLKAKTTPEITTAAEGHTFPTATEMSWTSEEVTREDSTTTATNTTRATTSTEAEVTSVTTEPPPEGERQ